MCVYIINIYNLGSRRVRLHCVTNHVHDWLMGSLVSIRRRLAQKEDEQLEYQMTEGM